MKRPWNLVDLPVYSLATYENGQVNMNICTYVSAISLKPKLYAVAVYKNTRSLHNLHRNSQVVLQVMHQSQAKLVKILGKRSGMYFDKTGYLEKNELLGEWMGLPVLQKACAYILLRALGSFDPGGDHLMYWFQVEKFKTNRDSGVLSTHHLMNLGIIS